MTGPGRRSEDGRSDEPEGSDEERRRRRAEVFGDVLPESTSDDRDPERGEPAGDEWLRSNVPPHHG